MNDIPGNVSQQPAGHAQKEDYLDKGLDAAEKKFGGAAGQDTQKNRAVNEKIVRVSPTCHIPYSTSTWSASISKMSFTDYCPRPMAHATCLRRRPENTSPIRSPTREKENPGMWKKLGDKWNRCRPYVERLNGTAMPLKHQGVEERVVQK